MTDNRTTELRRLLDERGVGYKPTRSSMLQTTFTANGVEWIVTECEATGELFVEPRHGLTPEQAIAATFGNGTLTAEQVRECVQHVYHEGYSDGSVRRGAHIDETDWQAIADELNAHVGRTCEPNWVLQGETQTQEFWRCECGNCGECFGVEDRSSFPIKMTIDKVDIPNFCPECGAKQKVVGE